jgi:hypothetical protein
MRVTLKNSGYERSDNASSAPVMSQWGNGLHPFRSASQPNMGIPTMSLTKMTESASVTNRSRSQTKSNSETIV